MLSMQPVLVIIFRKILGEFHWFPVHGQVRHCAARKIWRKPALPLTYVRTNDHVKDRVPSQSLGPFTGTFLDRATINFFTVSSNNSSSCYRKPLKLCSGFYVRIARVSMGQFNTFLRRPIYLLRNFFLLVYRKKLKFFLLHKPPPPHTHIQNQETKL